MESTSPWRQERSVASSITQRCPKCRTLGGNHNWKSTFQFQLWGKYYGLSQDLQVEYYKAFSVYSKMEESKMLFFFPNGLWFFLKSVSLCWNTFSHLFSLFFFLEKMKTVIRMDSILTVIREKKRQRLNHYSPNSTWEVPTWYYQV